VIQFDLQIIHTLASIHIFQVTSVMTPGSEVSMVKLKVPLPKENPAELLGEWKRWGNGCPFDAHWASLSCRYLLMQV
jgi:hypothetical protein